MSQLIDFYNKLIHFCGLEVDQSTGRIYDNSTSKKVYILIDDKEIVLPTYENLRNPNINTKIVFHPIPEHVARGESPVISKLTHILNIKLNIASSGLFRMFAILMHSPAKFKRLNPTQSELLNNNLKLIDKTGLLNIEKVMTNSISNNASRSILNIFLKKGAILDGVRYSKGGIVTFPLLDSLNDEEVFSVKLREKDKISISGMYDILFPDSGIRNKYSKGSKDDFIPYLESLCLASYSIAKQINEIVELFPDESEEFGVDSFDISFMDDLSNMTDIVNEARRIPSQPGNAADHPIASPIVPVSQAQQYVNTDPRQHSPSINKNNTLNFGSVIGSQVQQMPFMPPQQPIVTPFGIVGGNQIPMPNTRGAASWLGNYGPTAPGGMPFVGVQQPFYPQQPMYAPQQPVYQQPFYPQQPMYAPQQPMANNGPTSSSTIVPGRARF